MDSIPMSLSKELAGVRAVICDVYGTLLQVGPPPENAEELWQERCSALGIPRGSLPEFNAKCDARIATENARSRRGGEPYPEQDWMEIVLDEWPELHDLGVGAFVELSRLHARCCRTCRALPGALQTLQAARNAGLLLGIASNAQTYTISELRAAGIPFGDFDRKLIFLSGAHGFAKPSPRVFALLTERLAALDIEPWETLMVGDSLENDIAPAAAAGWRTWHIGPRTWSEMFVE